MNPLASPNRAVRLLMALTAISCILLIAGCGSSSSGRNIQTKGFSNASLNGTYVFTCKRGG